MSKDFYITIKDVAKESGVSVGTVSRALNNTGYVNAEKRRHILDVAQRMGYNPAISRKEKKIKKSNCIGVAMTDCTMPFFSSILFHLQQYLDQEGYQTILFNTKGASNSIQKVLDFIDRGMLDGAVIATNVAKKEQDRLTGKPIVSIEYEFGASVPLISSDHIKGGEYAAKLLRKNGCRNVAILSIKDDTPVYARHRIKRAMSVLKNYGISVRLVEENSNTFSIKTLQEMINDFMNENIEVDGIFTEDIEAYYCLLQARKRGLHVPRDLKIVGYDGHEITKLISPKVTTIVQNTKLIGETSGKVVLQLINHEKTEKIYQVPVKVRLGGTTI